MPAGFETEQRIRVGRGEPDLTSASLRTDFIKASARLLKPSDAPHYIVEIIAVFDFLRATRGKKILCVHQTRFRANACPDPDFRYFSNSSACSFVEKAT